jgi:hypothetical protein
MLFNGFPIAWYGAVYQNFICARENKEKKAWQVFPGVKIFVKHPCYFGMYVEQWISHSLVEVEMEALTGHAVTQSRLMILLVS